MVTASSDGLLSGLTVWLQAERNVRAAVLFGSHARTRGAPASADGWSDVDLHIVATNPVEIERLDWSALISGANFCFKVVRPATGGVRKLTVLFEEGEADLILVPAMKLRMARLAMKLGLHRRSRPVMDGLNAFATIMQGGYRFIKGENQWSDIYARVVAEMSGFRVADHEARVLADTFMCDLLWVLQKLERGELVAAQRILHRSLLETNIMLLHELRIRNRAITYQQARRVEQLVSREELQMVRVDAKLDRAELHRSAWEVCAGLQKIMASLVPTWSVPAPMRGLIDHHARPK